MANKQTEKSRYPSRYSPGGFVTEAQYIIELVCERLAQKQKKDLPVRFWNLPEWKLIFAGQLRATHALLKKYSAKAIINIIKEKKIDNIRTKWVEPMIAQEQIILNTLKTKENVSDAVEKVRAQEMKLPEKQVKKTRLGALMELDNG
jgi:hypothetical protein